jgi:hypothetical protein
VLQCCIFCIVFSNAIRACRFTLICFVSREEVEGAAGTSAATVFGQISQILRDGLNDASQGYRFFLLPKIVFMSVTLSCRMPFPMGISGHTSVLYPTMPPMITSPMQFNSAHAPAVLPTATFTSDLDHSVQLAANDNSAQIQPHVSETVPLNSHRQVSSEIDEKSSFDQEEFRALQTQTQHLSEQLTDFEVAWTPRSNHSSVDGDGVGFLKFPGDNSDCESDWA